MKPVVFFLSALVLALSLMAPPAGYANNSGAIENSTSHSVFVKEFDTRRRQSGQFTLRPGAQRNLRADTANVFAEMVMRSAPVACGRMHRAGGNLRVVASGNSCRIEG